MEDCGYKKGNGFGETVHVHFLRDGGGGCWVWGRGHQKNPALKGGDLKIIREKGGHINILVIL